MRAMLVLLGLCCSGSLQSAEPARKPLNVLFIMADDLRVELGCYGSPALTPNLDKLAKRAVQFQHAYCQQALCNPSRSSMLTGLRPDTLKLWANGFHFREKMPDVMTLPLWFKENGYTTRNVGKIFHNWHTKEKGDPRSWSAPEFLHFAMHGDDTPQIKTKVPENLAKAPRCEQIDVPDHAYFDGRVADEAIRVMGEVKEKPFFLAVGFWKPHAPFNAPKKYWELYQREKLPRLNGARPQGAPEIAFHDGRELRGIPPKQVEFTAAESAEIRHGYFAGISFMDEQVGKVLAALDTNKLTDSTIVVFVADHGYHLGEHGLWAKTSCYELDARVPLMVAVPGTAHCGKKTDSLVELIDLFPTLNALCGLKSPGKLDGTSLVAILNNPMATVKAAALTQHPRPAYYDRTEKGVPDAMGYSIRTARVRYTEWRDWKTGKVTASELYDHTRDTSELTNAIDRPPNDDDLAEARKLMGKVAPRK